ncbi:MAG TPA: SAM-dependent methyltransferase [Methanospirillum sp.]|nr:SAM-dependent methyltransferase [Methanospirillum sp.]
MRTISVPLKHLQNIIHEPWVDQSRRPYVRNLVAFVPVIESFPSQTDIPERKRIGRGYQKLGSVIAFHGSRPTLAEVQEVIGREAPGGIIWISGHAGVMREPEIEVLYGQAGEIDLIESGILYRLDVTRVMYSQGNREEKKRVAALVNPGETACDMFAGIGYFTLSLAQAGAKVSALEINPVSFKYLTENIRSNHLEDQVIPFCGDCRDLMAGFFNRIHMGHFDAIPFLPTALCHVQSGTTIHVHMIGDQRATVQNYLDASGEIADMSLHQVKKIGPGKWHMVADVRIR